MPLHGALYLVLCVLQLLLRQVGAQAGGRCIIPPDGQAHAQDWGFPVAVTNLLK